jgi:hypothetical protein
MMPRIRYFVAAGRDLPVVFLSQSVLKRDADSYRERDDTAFVDGHS